MYNINLVNITLSYFIITVQTIVPRIITRYSFPNCKKSFDGFPTTPGDDMKCVEYISCVARKSRSKANFCRPGP